MVIFVPSTLIRSASGSSSFSIFCKQRIGYIWKSYQCYLRFGEHILISVGYRSMNVFQINGTRSKIVAAHYAWAHSVFRLFRLTDLLLLLRHGDLHLGLWLGRLGVQRTLLVGAHVSVLPTRSTLQLQKYAFQLTTEKDSHWIGYILLGERLSFILSQVWSYYSIFLKAFN